MHNTDRVRLKWHLSDSESIINVAVLSETTKHCDQIIHA